MGMSPPGSRRPPASFGRPVEPPPPPPEAAGIGALHAELLLTPTVSEDALAACADQIAAVVADAVRRGIADGLAALDQMAGETPAASVPDGPSPADLTGEQLRTVGGGR